MNDYYSKDTVDAKLNSIHETALRIEAQTIKTNGRVTKLEGDLADTDKEIAKWKYVVIGGIIMAGVMGAPSVYQLVQNFL